MSHDTTPVTLRQKFGISIFLIVVLILPNEYWHSNGSLPLFGKVSIWLLTSLTAVAGALSFWLIAEKSDRAIGLLAGALAGIGGPVAFHIVFGGDDRVSRAAGFFVTVVGMAPGLLIGRLLARRAERKAKGARDDVAPSV